MLPIMRTTCISASRWATFLSASLLLLANCASAGALRPEAEGESTVSADSGSPLSFAESVLPESLRLCMKAIPADLVVSSEINPFYLRGDLDGDGEADHAFLVNSGSNRGIAVCLARETSPRILGAARSFDGMLDLGFDHWVVYPMQPVERGVEEDEPPSLRGEAILVLVIEAGSGLIYWNGRELQWYQQGD